MSRGRLEQRAPLLGLCLAGAAVRFATLGQQSFWLDEASTGRLVRMGLGGLLRALPDGESTPPLYYVLAWLWTRPFGTGEVGLRSLSAVLGTMTIPLVYAAGGRLLGRRAGLAAAALTAFAPLLIWYSQEARAYALLVALCAASLWAVGAAAAPEGLGRRALVLWAVISSLALATHYFAVFLIAAEALWLLRTRGRAAVPALGCVAAAGCALLPLAIHQRAQGNAGFIAQTPRATRLAQAAKQLAVGYDTPGQIAVTVAGAVLVLGLAWLLLRRVRGPARRPALGLAAVALATVCVPVVIALLGLDYVITRNLMVVWVPAALALSAAGALSGGRAGPVLVTGLCAVGLAATLGIVVDGRYQRDDWRAAARTLPGSGTTALVVTPASGRVPLAYYRPALRPLPAGGAAVDWIEVIGLGARGVGAPLRAPMIPRAPLALGGFAAPVLARRATFSVVRYRAAGPGVRVTPAQLDQLALAPGTPATVLAAGR